MTELVAEREVAHPEPFWLPTRERRGRNRLRTRNRSETIPSKIQTRCVLSTVTSRYRTGDRSKSEGYPNATPGTTRSLVAHADQQMPDDEIAAELGAAIVTVRSRRSRVI